ncbi:MAG: hypothetical protein KUG80_08925 [Gammaproteobacteria bacterium]|nr:hypothetical protein [Gammaproteobacteria bacterium]
MGKSLATGALALTLPLSSMAASDFNINGFANAGFTWTDTDETYVAADKDGSFSEVTFLGLQMRFQPNADVPVSFVTQLMARARDGWDVMADWAYISWVPVDNLSFNVGRVKAPLFLISEAYDVGVTYPWISPPEEIYGFANVPMTSMTGLSVDYSYYFDELWLRAQFYLGRDDFEIPAMGTKVSGELTRMTGVSLSVGNEELELRFGITETKFSMALKDTLQALPVAQQVQADLGAEMMGAIAGVAVANATINGLQAVAAGPAGPEQAAAEAALPAALGELATATDNLALANQNAVYMGSLFAVLPNGSGNTVFYSLGGRYNGDKVFLMAEIARREIEDVPFPDTTSGFVTAGYRMDKWMPHLTYSMVDAEDSILVNQTQASIIAGVRYDIQPWAAVKFEVQRVELGDANIRKYGPMKGTALPSTGLFNELPDLTTFTGDVPDSLNKVNLAITMVF